ncbi:ankyrin repeat-containing protein, partial [Reticulomyxa filosa]
MSAGWTLERLKAQQTHVLDIFDACRGGDLAFVRHVLEENPEDISLTNESGMTSLHVACSYGKVEVVRHILEQYSNEDLDMGEKDKENGWNSSHHAMYKGNLAVVKELFDWGCPQSSIFEEKDNNGWTPMDLLGWKRFRKEEYERSNNNNNNNSNNNNNNNSNNTLRKSRVINYSYKYMLGQALCKQKLRGVNTSHVHSTDDNKDPSNSNSK